MHGRDIARSSEAGSSLHADDARVLPGVSEQPSDILGDGRPHVLHEG
jgi:hypothetical protein